MNRRKTSFQIGRNAELRFSRCAKAKGFDVEKSSTSDDIHLHVDFWLYMDGNGGWGVDVKGNNMPDEIWCEFKNVNGDDGWMYGQSHIIAFDMPEAGGFCIVNTSDLRDYCEQNVDDVAVTEKRFAYKKKYTRDGRADVITKLHLSDIKQIISYRVWPYFL